MDGEGAWATGAELRALKVQGPPGCSGTRLLPLIFYSQHSTSTLLPLGMSGRVGIWVTSDIWSMTVGAQLESQAMGLDRASREGMAQHWMRSIWEEPQIWGSSSAGYGQPSGQDKSGRRAESVPVTGVPWAVVSDPSLS